MSNLGSFSGGEANIFTNFKPASRNLFTISIYDPAADAQQDGSPAQTDAKANGFDTSAIHTYTKYHAVSIKIGDEYLSLKRNPISKQFQVDGNESYMWADRLTIKWRESKDWEVRNYHEYWISSIYDKERDVYKAKPDSDPYRTIIIELPGDYSLKCEGILPRNIGSIDLAWGKGGSIIEPQLDYYVTKINRISKQVE